MSKAYLCPNTSMVRGFLNADVLSQSEYPLCENIALLWTAPDLKVSKLSCSWHWLLKMIMLSKTSRLMGNLAMLTKVKTLSLWTEKSISGSIRVLSQRFIYFIYEQVESAKICYTTYYNKTDDFLVQNTETNLNCVVW